MKYIRWIMVSCVVIAMTIISGYLIFCPIMKRFPQLTGPYHVGMRTFHREDITRESLLDCESSSDDNRILTIHIWYPLAEQDLCEPALYIPEKISFLRQLFSVRYPHCASFVRWLLPDIKTRSCSNGNISQAMDQFPVVLFSHGLFGFPSDMYAVFLEEIASHGFIVIGIDHTYFNFATLIAKNIVCKSAGLNEQFERMNHTEQMNFQAMAIDVYKDDIMFILNELEQFNNDTQNMLYQKLDLNHIGIMGHSAGGTAAIEVSRQDARLKACVDLDGWYDHTISWNSMHIPTLLLFGSASVGESEPSEEYLKRKGLTRDAYYERERKIAQHKQALCAGNNDCTMQIIAGASHEDFSDSVLLKWPLRSWVALDSYKLVHTINETIVLFFKKHLNKK